MKKKKDASVREQMLRKQIRELRRELADITEGARQLSHALDGVVAQVAVRYGTQTEQGFELRIPVVDLKESRYRVTAKYGTEGEEYIIAALPAQKD